MFPDYLMISANYFDLFATMVPVFFLVPLWFAILRPLYINWKRPPLALPPPPPPSVNKNDTQLFLDLHLQRFLQWIAKENAAFFYNTNISDVFYDKKRYQESMQECNNDLELAWKKRILSIYSPRGNIMMYFDPYKMGFVYFADQTMSYPVLNACAMRYCDLYRCLYFFMDEFVLPAEMPKNPLLLLYETEESTLAPSTSSRFLVTNKPKPNATPISNELRRKNRFIYSGKLANMQLLSNRQNNTNTNTNNFKTTLISNESYLEFKKKHSQK